MYIKNSIRIVYGENFKSFSCTLTDGRLSERSEGHTGVCKKTWKTFYFVYSLILSFQVNTKFIFRGDESPIKDAPLLEN